MRPPLGPKKKFADELERNIGVYCQYCWEIRVPKTQAQFGHELVHYLEYKGKHSTFPQNSTRYLSLKYLCGCHYKRTIIVKVSKNYIFLVQQVQAFFVG